MCSKARSQAEAEKSGLQHHIGLDARKPNNEGTDQPAHPHSLVSAFVICYLESTIPFCSWFTSQRGEISLDLPPQSLRYFLGGLQYYKAAGYAQRGGGGGGGVLRYFLTYVGSDHFLGLKILNFNIVWGFQKNKYFFGV